MFIQGFGKDMLFDIISITVEQLDLHGEQIGSTIDIVIGHWRIESILNSRFYYYFSLFE